MVTIKRKSLLCAALALQLVVAMAGEIAKANDAFPPGWLPVRHLDDKPSWSEVRKVDDRIHLYLPRGEKPVRGIFVCFVFHSGDPRELARLWDFAMVTRVGLVVTLVDPYIVREVLVRVVDAPFYNGNGHAVATPIGLQGFPGLR